jgi:hypothetical protein
MVIAPAVTFYSVMLAIHIAATIVAFGVLFAFPIFFSVVNKADRRALPALHRAEMVVGQRLITPGLAVVLIAGIYLASKLHEWSAFYVQWGITIAIVLGALGGLFFTPQSRKLIELSERDIAGAGDGEVTMSEEYEAVAGRVARVGMIASLLVLATVYFMATQTGA